MLETVEKLEMQGLVCTTIWERLKEPGVGFMWGLCSPLWPQNTGGISSLRNTPNFLKNTNGYLEDALRFQMQPLLRLWSQVHCQIIVELNHTTIPCETQLWPNQLGSFSFRSGKFPKMGNELLVVQQPAGILLKSPGIWGSSSRSAVL